MKKGIRGKEEMWSLLALCLHVNTSNLPNHTSQQTYQTVAAAKAQTAEVRDELHPGSLRAKRLGDYRETPNRIKAQLNIFVLELLNEDSNRIHTLFI